MRARWLVVAVLAVGSAAAGCDSADSTTSTSKLASTPATTTQAAGKRAATPIRAPVDSSLPRDVPVPVLMYHVIKAPPAGTPFPELWVPADRFAAEMKTLAAAGYHGVTLSQVDAHWRTGAGLPSKPLVVSFDDGYFSQYHSAAPVLRRLGWPGVLNMEVHNLHVEGGLSPRMVRSLIRDGWELAAHTINHVDVTKVDAVTLDHEIAGSRQMLRDQFHVRVDFFCYPAGKFNAAAIAAVRAAGYKGATTVMLGLARPDQLYELRRVRVNGSDSAARVRGALAALGA